MIGPSCILCYKYAVTVHLIFMSRENLSLGTMRKTAEKMWTKGIKVYHLNV